MNPQCYRTIAIFCANLEELIRENFSDCKEYIDQKVVLDLFLSVINYQNFFKKKELKNGFKTI